MKNLFWQILITVLEVVYYYKVNRRIKQQLKQTGYCIYVDATDTLSYFDYKKQNGEVTGVTAKLEKIETPIRQYKLLARLKIQLTN